MPYNGAAPASLHEKEGSRTMKFGSEPSAQRIAVCDSQDLAAALDFLMPTVLTLGGETVKFGGDRFPGFSWLQCDDVSVRPLGQMIQATSWNSLPWTTPYQELTISYLPQKWPDPSQPQENQDPENILFATQSLDYSVELLTVPVRVPVSMDPSKGFKEKKKTIRLSMINYSVEFPNFKNPPWALINEYNGCVNEQTMFGGEPETVLFDGPSASQEVYIRGERTWRIKYQFIYNRNNWNKTLNPETLEWVRTKTLQGEDKDPYPKKGLKQLLPGS